MMESINNILKEDITVVEHTLTLPGFKGNLPERHLAQMEIAGIIDDLGAKSSVAQGVSKNITSLEKLRARPNDRVYLLKDPKYNGCKGRVIGMLKVGPKKLFLHDGKNQVIETTPLCVLDFYIEPEYQRRGYGKKLFDYMLKDTGKNPYQLAIDGPSEKMKSFLLKYYNLSLDCCSYNFAVSVDFFKNPDEFRPTDTPGAPIGRYAAPRRGSQISSIIHGESRPGSAAVCTPTEPPRSPIGRYAAPKSPSNLSSIIHGESRPGSAAVCTEAPGEIEKTEEEESVNILVNNHEVDHSDTVIERPSTLKVETNFNDKPPSAVEISDVKQQSPVYGAFQLDNYQRPSTSVAEVPAATPAGIATPRRPSQVTPKGHLDCKFYHNKLW